MIGCLRCFVKCDLYRVIGEKALLSPGKRASRDRPNHLAAIRLFLDEPMRRCWQGGPARKAPNYSGCTLHTFPTPTLQKRTSLVQRTGFCNLLLADSPTNRLPTVSNCPSTAAAPRHEHLQKLNINNRAEATARRSIGPRQTSNSKRFAPYTPFYPLIHISDDVGAFQLCYPVNNKSLLTTRCMVTRTGVRIEVQSHIDSDWSTWLNNLQLVYTESGEHNPHR